MNPVRRWRRRPDLERRGRRLAPVAAALGAVALTLGVVACASQASGPKPTDPTLAEGWQQYQDHCATCHGGDGGGGSGPKLAGTVEHTFPDIADQIKVIEDGKNGGMPAWKGTLTATQIRDVAMYERQCLGRTSC